MAEKTGVSQKEIRNVQLAKSATLAAATILLEDAGCGKEDIEYVINAGALGENLSAASFRRLSFCRNTSLAAAEAACRERSFHERAKGLCERIHVLDLSLHPRFFDLFMKSLSL
ncbi:MAG: ASKHA domain-containing protein [Thermodesulfobacteriota bacterium]